MSRDEEDEEAPRHRKRKGGGRMFKMLAILIIAGLCVLGLFYISEKLQAGDLPQKLSECLSQQRVLDERFVQCAGQLQDTNGQLRSCGFQLQQCATE